ncbi:hypothetical protein BYT27DRAFT_7197755 [Phlegmacium glaucopus]|nr:hypothetical protein BYT27DRAFT_7197755 [Phlegmacium glaucopus]
MGAIFSLSNNSFHTSRHHRHTTTHFSSICYIHFIQIIDTRFSPHHLIFTTTRLTQISHGLGDGYYWFMGVHNFELCNARGGSS